MEKIGIITLNGYFNYGNRLQNYALQEILKSRNFNVETIWIENHKKKKGNKSGSKVARIFKKPNIILSKIYRILYLDSINNKRKNRFKQFSHLHINETKFKISEDKLHEDLLNEYAYFVTGSDQVWNPYYNKGSSLYFLTFAPKHKRISYAASFGISDLPNYCKNDYRKWLEDMEHLSVREEAGAEVIANLTGRTAEVLSDPTLLLSKKSWLSIAKPAASKPKEGYILTYFLGQMSDEVKRLLNKKSKKYDLQVINLAQPKYKEFYLTDPAEFLDFIHSAKLFLTDSFHGVVFSILFETPFVVTDRESKIPSMNSRINTLLAKYQLEERHISKVYEEDLLHVDFSHVEDILAKERKLAKRFLAKTLI